MSIQPRARGQWLRANQYIIIVSVVALLVGFGTFVLLHRKNQQIAKPDFSKMSTAQLRELASAKKPPAQVLTVLFDRLFKAKEYEEAYKTAKAFVLSYPSDARSHNALGIANISAGNPADATREFELAIAVEPRHVDGYVNLGHLAHILGDETRALAEYDRATSVNPNSASAWRGFGESSAALHY